MSQILRRSSLKYLMSLGVIAFLFIWIIGFSSSLLGARCLSDKTDVDEKITTCRWASLLTPSQFVASDRSEIAALEFERSIALIEIGKSEMGFSEMQRLITEAELINFAFSNKKHQNLNRVAIALLRRAQQLAPESTAYRLFIQAMTVTAIE